MQITRLLHDGNATQWVSNAPYLESAAAEKAAEEWRRKALDAAADGDNGDGPDDNAADDSGDKHNDGDDDDNAAALTLSTASPVLAGAVWGIAAQNAAEQMPRE